MLTWEAEFVRIVFIRTSCTLLLLLLLHHNNNNNNNDHDRKEQRSCIKDCLSLYGGNIPLFTGRTLNVNMRSTRGRGKPDGSVRPLTRSHDISLFHRLFNLNVFICLHRGAPCISVDATGSPTESRMHACKIFLSFFLVYDFFLFFLMKLLIRETTRVH